MIKDVFNSLMNDKVRTFFCWITFTITSMFIFLFFTVAMSDAVGVTMIRGKSDIPTILMVASVIFCFVQIEMLYNTYLSKLYLRTISLLKIKQRVWQYVWYVGQPIRRMQVICYYRQF